MVAIESIEREAGAEVHVVSRRRGVVNAVRSQVRIPVGQTHGGCLIGDVGLACDIELHVHGTEAVVDVACACGEVIENARCQFGAGAKIGGGLMVAHFGVGAAPLLVAMTTALAAGASGTAIVIAIAMMQLRHAFIGQYLATMRCRRCDDGCGTDDENAARTRVRLLLPRRRSRRVYFPPSLV